MPSSGSFPEYSSMILIVDNYDSFVHNVARYFEELGAPAAVVRNDAVTSSDLAAARWRPAHGTAAPRAAAHARPA